MDNIENMNYEQLDKFVKEEKIKAGGTLQPDILMNTPKDRMINDVIKQDKEAYLAAMKASIVNYIVLRIQKGMGYITAIHPMVSKDITAKDVWDAMPEEYKVRSVPVSFKDEEYILTWDFCEYLKEVAENEHDKTL